MTQVRIAQCIILLSGVFYMLAGLALLFAPAWFFDKIGPFPPFNRHYMGDLGSFLLPMGVGLLLAARDPARQRLLIGLMIAGSLLHTANHSYDALVGAEPLSHWLADVGPLVVIAALMLVAYALVGAPAAAPGAYPAGAVVHSRK